MARMVNGQAVKVKKVSVDHIWGFSRLLRTFLMGRSCTEVKMYYFYVGMVLFSLTSLLLSATFCNTAAGGYTRSSWPSVAFLNTDTAISQIIKITNSSNKYVCILLQIHIMNMEYLLMKFVSRLYVSKCSSGCQYFVTSGVCHYLFISFHPYSHIVILGLLIKIITGSKTGDRVGMVVKVLCYKSEGRWFDSRWCHWNFSVT